MKLTMCVVVVTLVAPGLATGTNDSGGASLAAQIATIREVADGYPPRLDGPDDRARIETLWRELEKGLLAYSAAHEGDPNGQILLGDLYRMGHNLDIKNSGLNAVTHLEGAIKLDPANSKPYYLLGKHWTFSGELEKGQLALLQAYVRAEPAKASSILFDLTFNSYFRKDYGSAILFAERYLTVVPNSPAVAFIRDRSREGMAGRKFQNVEVPIDGPPEEKLKVVPGDQPERKP